MGFSPILILSFAILICGWIVAVAGIGSLQAANWSVTVNGTTRDASLSSHALSFEWFVLSFEFFMIVILLVLTFMKKLATFHSAVNANLAFCSALWAIFANQFYQIVRNAEGTALYTALSDAGYYPTSRSNTLIAGACILIAGNFLAMFGACWDDDDDTFSSKPAKAAPVTEVPVQPTPV